MRFCRPLLLVIFALGSSFLCFAATPNIILITLDTTRTDRMGFLNSKLGLTPNLDLLAGQSVIFTRAYSHVPLTTPSHATILTGTYPQFNHVSDLGSPLTTDLPFLPDILRKKAYKTAAFIGSQVLDPKSGGAPGFDRGFDTYDAPFHPRAPGEDRYQSVERRAMAVVDTAQAWLSHRPQGAFFLWLHLYDPHDPYDPPPPFKDRYASPYDGEIAYTDSAIGKFLQTLRLQGLYEQSLIVVVADHGEGLGDHGEQSHGVFLYDETIHVPLLIKLPGKSPIHQVIESRVGLVDIAPTVLEVVGVPIPSAMQGRSVREWMRPGANPGTEKSATAQDRPQYAETDYPYHAFGWSSLRSWRASKYLYIDAPRRELYDQASDPGATHNLNSRTSAVADTMSAQLDDFRRKTDRAGKTEAVLTPHQAEQLRSLGYVSSGSSKPESEQKERGADPKDKIEIANWMHDALLKEEQEQYREAIPLFEQILKADPNSALANLQLGRTFNSLEDYGKAIPLLQKAVELTPESAEAHYELGAALGETGDWAGSAKQLEAAIAQDPSSDDLHFYLGSAYEEMDRIDDAIKQYQAALQINPDNFRANLFLGRQFAIQNHPNDALPLLQKAVQLRPESSDAHKFLGSLYIALGEPEKGRREQAEAQRLNTTPQP